MLTRRRVDRPGHRGRASEDSAEVEGWVRQYVREPPSDAEALEVFTALVDPLP
jgi:hypothetical protein